MDRWDELEERGLDDGSEASRDELKRFALSLLSEKAVAKQVGPAMFNLLGWRIHVRHTYACTGANWPFDINPTTLKADFELWICGWPSLYYLTPIDAIKYMHAAATAYRNYARTATTIVRVNEDLDECSFACDEGPLDFGPFRHARIPPTRN